MFSREDILNGGGWQYTEYSGMYPHYAGHRATRTAWVNGAPILSYGDKYIVNDGRAFTQDKLIADTYGLPLIDMNAPDSAALGDLVELQTDAAAKAGYLGSEGATWINKEAYTGEYAETTAEIDILKTLMSGQTTQPAGTGTQPEGTQPEQPGLNPLHIGIGLSVAALAALALTKGVKA